MRTDKILEIGNLVPPRALFDNPQEGRVYDGGVSLRASAQRLIPTW